MQLKIAAIVQILITILLLSCEKDDERLSRYFIYDGETYMLEKGFIWYFSQNGTNSYSFDMLLTSESVAYNPTTNLFSGIGEIIRLDLVSSSPNGLVSGSYHFSHGLGGFSFSGGILGVGADASVMNGTMLYIIGGTINVEVSCSHTSLNFNLTTSDNKRVKGKFSGELIRTNI